MFRFSLADGNIHEFSEKDGFPAPAITALKLAGGRLLVGFNGALGYLDTGSEKFTGLMAGLSLHKNWSEANLEPPSGYIDSLITQDGNNFWVASQNLFQHFDFGANKWEAATSLPIFRESGFLLNQGISVNANYVLTPDMQHCFAARRRTETNWWTVNLRANSQGDESSAVALDQARPDWVRIGDDNGAINLVDLATLKITASGQIPLKPIQSLQRAMDLPGPQTQVLFIGWNKATTFCAAWINLHSSIQLARQRPPPQGRTKTPSWPPDRNIPCP